MKKSLTALLILSSSAPVLADIETDALRASVAFYCAEKMTIAGEVSAASQFRADGQNYITIHTNNMDKFKAAIRKHKSRARSIATDSKCRQLAAN